MRSGCSIDGILTDMLQTVRDSSTWSLLARNVHRIAFSVFAVIFVLLFVNAFIASDQDTARRAELPIATDEADRRGDPVDREPSQAGLILAGFGLLGGWAVLGIVIGSKPSRQRAAAAKASES